MKPVFEKGSAGRRLNLTSPCDVPQVSLEKVCIHEKQPHLPHMSENKTSRHYTELVKCSHDVNDGFHPSGSCTMKYNPKVNEEATALKGFRGVHPLQPEVTVQGFTEVSYLVEEYLREITGTDAMTFQPTAGAHGGFTGPLLVRAYHAYHNDTKRTKIIILDSAREINPASAFICGYDVMSIPSREDGCVDLEQLKAAIGEDIAGLMLTNPDTVGLSDKNILEIAKVIHDAGRLHYYDGVNLNAVMGIVRLDDMGFDVAHPNLYKTFSTPHGDGGPESGPMGCKEILKSFIPGVHTGKEEDAYHFVETQDPPGDVKMLYGNFLAVVKALSYILTLGKEGTLEATRNTVLNTNYMRMKLSDVYDMARNETCVHKFVMSLEEMKHDRDMSATGIIKAFLNYDIHPPTVYFPLIIHEALMVEPTEAEFRETLGEAIEVFHKIYKQAPADPETLHNAFHLIPIGRPDEVAVTRKPVLRYTWEW